MKSPQQRYDEAAARNVTNFFANKPTTGSAGQIRPQDKFTNADKHTPVTLDEVKHSLGIRARDTGYDAKLNEFVTKHAKVKTKKEAL